MPITTAGSVSRMVNLDEDTTPMQPGGHPESGSAEVSGMRGSSERLRPPNCNPEPAVRLEVDGEEGHEEEGGCRSSDNSPEWTRHSEVVTDALLPEQHTSKQEGEVTSSLHATHKGITGT